MVMRNETRVAHISLIAFAFGCGLVVMAIMSRHYDSRIEAMQKAHQGEISAQERRHSREKTKIRKDILEKLEDIQRKVGG